jgi:hypothetical protein
LIPYLSRAVAAVITRLLFPLFILFSRKEKLIGVIDSMIQKEQNIDKQIKVKLIIVIDDSSRKRKTRKESLRD